MSGRSYTMNIIYGDLFGIENFLMLPVIRGMLCYEEPPWRHLRLRARHLTFSTEVLNRSLAPLRMNWLSWNIEMQMYS